MEKLQQGHVTQSEESGVEVSGVGERPLELAPNPVNCGLLYSTEVLAHLPEPGAAGCGHSQLPQT